MDIVCREMTMGIEVESENGCKNIQWPFQLATSSSFNLIFRNNQGKEFLANEFRRIQSSYFMNYQKQKSVKSSHIDTETPVFTNILNSS